jgi:hypothetical protein
VSAHLGDRVSALADGQLAPAAAERALAHVAGCPRCASDLAAARAARRMLCDVDDVRPAGDLTARLLALGCGGDAPAPAAAPRRAMDPFVPPTGARGAAAAPAGGTTGPGLLASGRQLLGGSGGVLGSRAILGPRGALGARPALGSRGVLGASGARRGVRAAVGSLTGLGVVAVGLFLLGDRPAVAPATAPADARSVLGGAAPDTVPVAAGAPGGTSSQAYLDWMRAEGWTCPADLPAGWAVTAVRLRDGGATLEADLTGPTGGEVVVTERQGRLDVSALTAADRLDLDDRSVYVLSTAPWHAAWQSGDTVVEVVSGVGAREAAAVVAHFPHDGFDAGLPARLTRGWDTFTAAMHLP